MVPACSLGNRPSEGQQPPWSRCFRQLVVCAAHEGNAIRIWTAAQFFVAQYKGVGHTPVLPLSAPGKRKRRSSESLPEKTLRIIFMARAGSLAVRWGSAEASFPPDSLLGRFWFSFVSMPLGSPDKMVTCAAGDF